MKRAYLTMIAAFLFAAASMAQTQQAAPSQSQKSFGGTVVGTEHATAKVKKIDRKTRQITLQGENGQKVVFTAGPEVQNFDQIKKGDTVNVAYTEAVRVEVSGAGAAVPKSREQTTEMERAPKGAKPAGAITQTTDVYGVVKDINYQDRTATLQGPERTVTVKVGPEAKNFNQVKVGDNVHITYVQRLAMAVSK